MITTIATIVCCVVIGVPAPVPSDAEVRKLLADKSLLDESWQTSLVALADRFPSKDQFVDRLVSFLNDDDEDIRRGALCGLIRLRRDAASAVPAVARVLRDDSSPSVREWAVDTLYWLAGKDSLKHLAIALKDQSPGVRAAALRVVGQEASSASGFVTNLRKLLSDRNHYSYAISRDHFRSRPVRYEAVIALGKIGDNARVALPKLRRMLAEAPNAEVRLVAAVAVAQLDEKDKSGIRYLMTQVESASSEYSQFDAVFCLSRLGNRARASVPLLMKLLKSDHSALVRSGCASALPSINGAGQDTVAALINALGDSEPAVQMAALESLAELGRCGASAVPAVKRLLDKYSAMDEEDIPCLQADIRVQAIVTLLATGKPKLVTPMIEDAIRRVQTESLRSEIQELLKHSLDSQQGQDGLRQRGSKRGDRNGGIGDRNGDAASY